MVIYFDANEIWHECIGKWFNERVKVNGKVWVVKCFGVFDATSEVVKMQVNGNYLSEW